MPESETMCSYSSSKYSSRLNARSRLRDLAVVQLAKWGVAGDVIDDVTLVVSELATNSVAACLGRIIALELYTLPGGLVAEVLDPSTAPPVRRTAREDATDGRGLMIVDALAERWGVRRPPAGGKAVWARFRRP